MSYKIPQDLLGTLTGDEFFGHSTDGPDIYSVTLNDSIMPLQAGKMFKVKFDNTNTVSVVTLEVFGVGMPINVVKNGSLPLLANDIMAGEILLLVFDGTNYQIISKVLPTAVIANGSVIAEPLIWNGSSWVPAGGISNSLPLGNASNDTLTWNGTNWASTSLADVYFQKWGNTIVYNAAQVPIPVVSRMLYYIDSQGLSPITLDMELPISPAGGFEVMVILWDDVNGRTVRINAQTPNLIYKLNGGEVATYIMNTASEKLVHLVYAENINGGNWVQIRI